MNRNLLERRLKSIGARLRRQRMELSIADEQLRHLKNEADDARVRSLVSETALADRERRGSDQQARAMYRHHTLLSNEIAELEMQQDELLDQIALLAEGSDG
jgi:uncharacterized protein (DUF3084 family)